MDIKVIKTDGQYREMLSEAERLVSLDPNSGTREGEMLELISVLIEDFEKRNFPFECPDPISAIEFRMIEQGLRQIDLAPLLGSRSRVSEVLSRKRPLTVQMVRSVSAALGIPAEILIAERGSKENNKFYSKEGFEWSKFPVKEMVKRGWFQIENESTLPARKAAEESVKKFLNQIYDTLPTPALFRRTFRGENLDEKTFYSTLAWTARVLTKAKECLPYPNPFQPNSLNAEFFSEIAKLSYFSDGSHRAINKLLDKGIVVIVEPKLPNTLLDGAAMLAESGLPVIGITLRYDRVDYFWFTLLHELAHVWKHLNSPEEAFVDRIEGTATDTIVEKEANRIARDALIPRAIWSRSPARLNPSRETILQLAEELHIHPAIVVGRLQQELERFDIFREFLGQNTIRSQFGGINFS